MNMMQSTAIEIGKNIVDACDKLSPVEFANSIDLAIYDRIESVREDWLLAEKTSSISVYQRYGWVKEFLNSDQCSSDTQPFIVTGKVNGEIVFILPFALHGTLIRRMQFIGGSHVNFNLGIFSEKYTHLMCSATIKRIFKRLTQLTPGMGYAKLCCQPESWQGITNPLLHLTNQPSANPAFVLDLKATLEETIAQGNAKRKRKKFRSQVRQCEELGGYEFLKVENLDDAGAVLEAFFEQKAYRLKSLGIRDVFSDDCVHIFLENLVKNSNKDAPLLQLYALKIGGKIAAVFGCGVLERRVSGYFSSIDIQQFSAISPGEMLLYLIVEDCCLQGYEQIDLGAGEERYKTSWCTQSIAMHDVIMPLSVMSHPIVTARRVYGDVRRVVRDNSATWNLYKKARKLISGRTN